MGLYWVYNSKFAPTKIALVNYRDYMATKIIKANKNKFINIDIVKQKDLNNLSSYDFTLIFGMGLKLTPEEIATIQNSGSKVYLWAATNPNIKLTNLYGKNLDKISEYLDNAGIKNYSSLVNYIRKEIDHKSFFVNKIEEPQNISGDVFFRL